MDGVFSGLPAHALSGWQFVDLNGDKKDDRKLTALNWITMTMLTVVVVWVDANGQVTTWINRRGFRQVRAQTSQGSN
jgi:hypothetical protein